MSLYYISNTPGFDNYGSGNGMYVFGATAFPVVPYSDTSTANFKSVRVGNWLDPNMWKKEIDGVYVETNTYPDISNNIFVDAATTVVLNDNVICTDVNLNVTSDIVRVNHNGFIIEVYGKLSFYPFPANSGVLGWIGNGTYKFRGDLTRCIMVQGEVNANNNNSGHNIYIDFPSDAVAFLNDRYRATNWDIISGTLDNTGIGSGTTTGQVVANELRMGTNGGASDLTPDGSFVIRSGAKVIGSSSILKKANCAGLTFTLEQGGTLEIYKTGFILAAKNLDLSGTVILNSASAITFPTASTLSQATAPDTFATVWSKGAGAKSLVYNTTINTLLIIEAGSISLNSKTLSYGTDADLQIKASLSRGSELPASSSGTSIPRNLILDDGVTYDLGGATVNIRGSLQAGVGATVTNGTLNQNQP